MRLPKPIATRVRFQSKTLGSVYTAAQMKAYATKAVEAEREACLQDLRELIPPIGGGPDETPMVRSELQWVVEQCIAAIRARRSK